MYKKVLLFVLGAALTASSVIAQERAIPVADKIVFGIQAGYNLSGFWGPGTSNHTRKPGFQLGVIADRSNENSPFSLRPGLLFSQRGAVFNNSEITLNYLKLYPANGRYNWNISSGIKVFCQFGTHIGLAINGREKKKVGGEWGDSKNLDFGAKNMQRFDYGLGFGAGVMVMKRIELGLGYEFGLESTLKDPPKYFQNSNSNWAFTVAFLFGK